MGTPDRKGYCEYFQGFFIIHNIGVTKAVRKIQKSARLLFALFAKKKASHNDETEIIINIISP